MVPLAFTIESVSPVLESEKELLNTLSVLFGWSLVYVAGSLAIMAEAPAESVGMPLASVSLWLTPPSRNLYVERSTLPSPLLVTSTHSWPTSLPGGSYMTLVISTAAKTVAGREKTKIPRMPLSHEQISELQNESVPDWEVLMNNVEVVPVGIDNSRAYEIAIEQLLTVLFYPNLTHPVSQSKIHEGRKRIDITYTNVLINRCLSSKSAAGGTPLTAGRESIPTYVGKVTCPEERSDIGIGSIPIGSTIQTFLYISSQLVYDSSSRRLVEESIPTFVGKVTCPEERSDIGIGSNPAAPRTLPL